MATSLTLNIEKYCYSYLNGLADLCCLRGRCLPIVQIKINITKTKQREMFKLKLTKQKLNGEQLTFNCSKIYKCHSVNKVLSWQAPRFYESLTYHQHISYMPTSHIWQSSWIRVLQPLLRYFNLKTGKNLHWSAHLIQQKTTLH